MMPVGQRVFIVDDDISVRKSLERLMRSAQLQVETFASAEEFLEREVCEEHCCLLLDVCMPGLNGIELQEILTKKRRTIPIVFMTAHGDIPMSVKAMKDGAVDFLPKPLEERELLKAIGRAIEKDSLAKQAQTGRADV